ncbi:unnamed protein product [Closterium sp. NIES-64]|nr:unnamed protein product [Closterium sp. NIES-64]
MAAFLVLEELRKRESLSEEQLLVAEKLISCNPNVWHASVVRIRPCLPPATGVPGPGGAAQECVAIRGAAAGSREAHVVQPQMFDMFVLFVCPLVPQAFLALEELRKSASPSEEQLLAAEKLISEAFSIIDRSVKVNAIHENKGARRKARLSRAKRATLVSLGWYTPEPAAA